MNAIIYTFMSAIRKENHMWHIAMLRNAIYEKHNVVNCTILNHLLCELFIFNCFRLPEEFIHFNYARHHSAINRSYYVTDWIHVQSIKAAYYNDLLSIDRECRTKHNHKGTINYTME